MNTRKGKFAEGNRASVGHGRPKKHITISTLEQLRDEVCNLSNELLHAIANREQYALKIAQIPLSQVTEKIQTLAAGLLYLRSKHE